MDQFEYENQNGMTTPDHSSESSGTQPVNETPTVHENYAAFLKAQEEAKAEKPKKKDFIRNLLVILACIALILGITLGIYYLVNSIVSKYADQGNKDQQPTVQSAEAADKETRPYEDGDPGEKATLSHSDTIGKTDLSGQTYITDVSEVVNNIMPTVVSIVNKLEYTYYSSYNPYNYFFGGHYQDQEESKEASSSGSGVIVGTNDTELLIVTNAHVVSSTISSTTGETYKANSSTLTITFSDGSTADATIKGADENEDLAVVAVKLADLTNDTKNSIKIAVIGDSDSIPIGAGVIAIGNALGYGQSVTAGIISAKDRTVTIDGITRSLIQTDAAINPGNSGGGLFNSNGELIGINSAKTTGEEVEGMGFAIPITKELDLIEDLMNRQPLKEEEKGYLGITGQSVPESYATNYGYPRGAIIQTIYEGSPAEKAGLQIYDIITAINGTSVTSMDEMKELVNSFKAGTVLTVTVSRPSGRRFKEMTFEVELITYDELEKLANQ